MKTAIKLCGLSRLPDVQAANALKPEYVGFVFASASRRYVSPAQAAALRRQLDPAIGAVGVFVRESLDRIVALVQAGIIQMVQLHGNEDESDLQALQNRIDCPILQAFRIETEADIQRANASRASCVLLDSGGGGTGEPFAWKLLRGMRRPYMLAGGLTAACVGEVIRQYHPYAVDVCSGIETNGWKDPCKMRQFVAAVRKEDV